MSLRYVGFHFERADALDGVLYSPMNPPLSSSADARRRADRRTRRRDRVARRLIAVGGVSVVFCVLLMLVLIASTALPLFRPASAALLAELPPDPAARPLLASGVADDASHLYTLDDAGTLRVYRAPGSGDVATRELRKGSDTSRIRSVSAYGNRSYGLFWDNGHATHLRVRFRTDHTKPDRPTLWSISTEEFAPPAELAADAAHQFLRQTDDGYVRIALNAEGAVRAWFYDEDAELTDTVSVPASGPFQVTAAAADERGRALFAGTARGRLLRWTVSSTAVAEPEVVTAFADGRAISGLGVSFGDISVVMGDDRGGVTVWAPVALYGTQESKRLSQIHDLGLQPSPAVSFAFTRHDRSFLAVSADGTAMLANSTSSRRLATLSGSVQGVAFSQKGDLAVGFGSDGTLRLWDIRNPHPEISLRTLFARVFYEGYERPEYVWQSSSANDDFEPKYSLMPLLFGSIKATTYALLFAVPLALFGALYTSQFTTPGLRGAIKPLVELMSAVPSVVIGILAALWLAPRIEQALVGTMLVVVAVPITTALFVLVWTPLRSTRWGRRIERGWEFVIALPVLLAGVGLALWVGPILEQVFFAGDFAQWSFQHANLRIDQRNSLVIAFALGFAVIPTVFTMSEDALSNVPRSLTAASLALGASRWQTVRRVVLPSASPGICAAIIIGFGRAVGETMIVLMATGNTPLMDWSPFNGMRTLSANIAVEIPEAPIGGTLYRTLFLSAVLLFLLTAILNTAAEIIRQRLRKRYGY